MKNNLYDQAKQRSVNEQIDAALHYQKTGDSAKAFEIYSDIIANNNASARLFNNMGALLYELGQRHEALTYFEKALLIDIEYSDTWSNLEIDAQDVSGYKLTSIAQRLRLKHPTNTDCICAEAIGLMHSGKQVDALALFRDALLRDPNCIAAQERLVKCLIAIGDYDTATLEMFYLLSMDQKNVTASLELASLAFELGDTNSAISILDSLLDNETEDVQAQNFLGLILHKKGDLESAISTYKKILVGYPDCYEVRANLGSCYHELGLIDNALEQYAACVHDNSTPAAIHPAIFFCAAMGANCINQLKEWSQIYWRVVSSKASVYSKYLDEGRESSQDAKKTPRLSGQGSKIRIGIITGDLGMHAVSCFLSSFLMNYDKSSFHVEVICTKKRMDDAAMHLSQFPDKIIAIGSLSDAIATDSLLRGEYDIIIETSGFTSGSAIHLLANRCAPVQAHWIGYHASTHLPTMDFFIGDSVIIPKEHSSHFSEDIIRLQRAWVAATPFYHLPEASCQSREEIVIGAFSQVQKITSETLDIWGTIMGRRPHVKLLIKDRLVGNTGSKKRIFSRLQSHNVDPCRVILQEQRLSWQEHMMMYNSLDMALDTTPWSAATTAFDALSMGVPLVALRGETLAGLQSTSALWHLGRHEWIANSKDEYIEKCCKIIDEIAIHRKGKRTLQAEVLESQLFDQRSLCTEIENALMHTLA
jgi:protein O-GlcNAc transferase